MSATLLEREDLQTLTGSVNAVDSVERARQEPTTSPSARPVTTRKSAPVRRSIGRSFGRSLGTWTAIILSVLLLGTFGGPLLRRVWGGFNPMAQKTVDRTGPALLAAITGLHDYRAAEGTFQVTVDIEKDAKWLPAAIRGEHVVLNAVGHVDAGVDLSNLGPESVAVEPKTGAVSVTLPHATLHQPELDLAASKIVQHKRGILDRLGSTFGDPPATDRAVYGIAESKLRTAAQASDLTLRAEINTRQMLVAFAKGLGHDNVTINFAPSVPPGVDSQAARQPAQRRQRQV
jgi:Protein of unknown function (DUF4230)